MLLALASGFSRPFEVGSSVSQAGGELIVRGDFSDGRNVLVLVDGVATNATVFESATCVRVRVPALPRSGAVPVDLAFADGELIRLDGELQVSPPSIEIRD